MLLSGAALSVRSRHDYHSSASLNRNLAQCRYSAVEPAVQGPDIKVIGGCVAESRNQESREEKPDESIDTLSRRDQFGGMVAV
jgi:hypothetical protein